MNTLERRVVSPPAHEHASLRQPLTPGERLVFEFFDRLLAIEWEIYVQPFLNGVRPDFVLVNPAVGIAVYEIKDWDLDAMEYTPAAGRDDAALRVNDGEQSFLKESPLAQLRRYRKEIAGLYLPHLLTGDRIAAITGGVVFTRATTARARGLLEPALTSVTDRQRPYLPIAGRDALDADDLEAVFPEFARRSSKVMSEALAEELRRWLREPEHSVEQRTPIALDRHQRPLAERRTASGYRRIRGPAGSGKSAILARRANLLSQDGRDVLVVSFNHTLRTYLQDLVVRDGGHRNAVTWLGFHEWCKRTMRQAGRADEYDELAGRIGSGEKAILKDELPSATLAAIRSGPTRDGIDRYDAILVDEGQDFRPSWWAALRAAVRDDGEMMLVADRAQDIYDTGRLWTDEAMVGAGFSGPWNELAVSYRMPPALTRLVASFRRQFMPDCEGEAPEASTQDQLPLLRLRWRHVGAGTELGAVLEEIDRVVDGGSYSDIGVMTATTESAVAVVNALYDRGIDCIHTMSDDDKVERQLKHYFFRGDSRVKVTPIHNFKGWEMPRCVIMLEDSNAKIAYTALSRLSIGDGGSSLSVVSSVNDFVDYGRTWPEFEIDGVAATDAES